MVITVPLPGGTYKVKYTLPVLNMRVNKPVREDFQKEFTIVTKKKSFAAFAL